MGVGVRELVFYPLPNSHLLSAPIHSELTDSIAFSRERSLHNAGDFSAPH